MPLTMTDKTNAEEIGGVTLNSEYLLILNVLILKHRRFVATCVFIKSFERAIYGQ